MGVSVGEMNLAVADLHTPAVTTDEGRDALTSLAEAVRTTPSALPEGVVARAREHLTDEQAVEVVLDVVCATPPAETADPGTARPPTP